MCNRARNRAGPKTLFERFRGDWLTSPPRDGRFDPVELYPATRAYVIRQEGGSRGLDIMMWDVLHGATKVPATTIRNLKLQQWRWIAQNPAKRCLIPLTEFCGARSTKPGFDDGKPSEGETWFGVVDQPVFAVAGLWQEVENERCFAMVTCDPNTLIDTVHSKAMVTILDETDWDRWLTGHYIDILALQRPICVERMTVRGPVSSVRERS